MELSPLDLDYGARTLLAEGGDPVATAAVIRNRALSGKYGHSVAEIVTKPYQFEPWLHAGTGRIKNDPLAYSPQSPEYQRAASILAGVFGGQISDPTGGATHFLQANLQRNLGREIPKWAAPGAQTAQIGPHTYYAPEGKVMAGGGGEDWLDSAEKEFVPGHMAQPKEKAEGAPAADDGDWLGSAEQNFRGHMAPGYQQPAPIAPPEAPKHWGFRDTVATGLTLGAAPYIAAGVSALKDRPEGMGLSEAYNTALGNIQAEREAYARYAPKASMAGEMAGSLVGTAVPMGMATRGVAAAGNVLGRAVPALEPALQGAGRFLSGRVAETAAGPMAAIPRGVSYAAQGALQGAGAGALTHGLQPEGTTFGEGVASGALGGALMGPLVNPLVGMASAPFRAEIADPLRNMALRANQKFGLNIRPTQLTQNAELRALDGRVIPEHVNDAQVVKFNEELAKRVGLAGHELTRDNIEAGMRHYGDEMTRVAASASLVPNKAFGQTLSAIRNNIYNTTLTGDPLQSKIDQFLMRTWQELSQNGGVMSGNALRAFVKKDGLINRTFYKTDPTVARELRDAFFDMFDVADPALSAQYQAARDAYRRLSAIEPLAKKQGSGIIDPTKVLARFNAKKIGGELRELAEAGRYLPASTSTGEAKVAKKSLQDWGNTAMHWAGSFAPYIAPVGAGAAGIVSPTGAGFGAALLGGGQYAGSQVRGWAMAHPTINRMVLEKSPLPLMATEGVQNVLARGAGILGAQVGAE